MNILRRKPKSFSKKATGSVNCYSFGDPESVLATDMISHSLGVTLHDNGTYYVPPLPLFGLGKLLGANAYHGPILEFKTNIMMRNFQGSRMLPRKEMKKAVQDYNVFSNAYFQKFYNGYGELTRLAHLPALNMRRLKEPGRYGQLTQTGQMIPFRENEILHLYNYDVMQTIYGVPAYIGAIQSMLLNEDATLFRRRYYKNGAHVGYIFYSTSAALAAEDQTKIRAAIERSRGVGNFKNMFLHIPGAGKDDIQIKPVGDYSTKDDLVNIKSLSRDDIIAAHRIPPAMANVIPTNSGGFGDITKIDTVYYANEIVPVQQDLLIVNDVLPISQRVNFDSSTG